MERSSKLKFNERKINGLSGNQFKLIAFFLMLCDSVGYILIENGVLYGNTPMYWSMALATPLGQQWFRLARALRFFGRLSFPILAYLLVEGFFNTRSERKYAIRLFVFSVLSEIPFDLATRGELFYWDYQNTMFTFFLGFMSMIFMDKARKLKWPVQALIALPFCAIAYFAKTDYGAMGVALISVLYLLKSEPKMQLVAGALLSAAESYSYYGVSAIAFLLLRLYNGKRGDFELKYLFYFAYPLHFLLFYFMVQYANR